MQKKIKLMWADANSVLWELTTEKEVSHKIPVLSETLKTRIDVWKGQYKKIYKIWLDHDQNGGLFDFKSQLNSDGTISCRDIEKELGDVRCYYWFDIDRSQDDKKEFIWLQCPLCNSQLLKTGLNNINRAICEHCRLVFP